MKTCPHKYQHTDVYSKMSGGLLGCLRVLVDHTFGLISNSRRNSRDFLKVLGFWGLKKLMQIDFKSCSAKTQEKFEILPK